MPTWVVTTPLIGGVNPKIDTSGVSTLTEFALGSVVKAKDSTLGEAEFILLTGVASTEIGSVVTYEGGRYQSALLIANASSISAVSGRHVAVAMSANLADAKGWYCIRGNVPVLKNTSYASALLAFSSSAAGSVKSATTSGQAIERMFSIASTTGSVNSATTASTDTVVMQLHYPSVEAVPPPATG